MKTNNNFVKVTPDANGNVLIVSANNPEWGYVRVTQSLPSYDAQGFLRLREASALIVGRVADLQQMDYRPGQMLPGRIVTRESLTPFNPNDPDRDLKYAGSTGVLCRVDDQPIYRRSFYSPDATQADELIAHTNGDEIRQAQAAARQTSSSPSRRFALIDDLDGRKMFE